MVRISAFKIGNNLTKTVATTAATIDTPIFLYYGMAILAAKDQFLSYGILEIFQSNWQSNIFSLCTMITIQHNKSYENPRYKNVDCNFRKTDVF